MSRITDQVMASDRLADALWFLRGFAASKGDEHGEIAKDLSNQLISVRCWLNDIGNGAVRLLGEDESEFRVVLGEGEYERLVEAINSPQAEEIEIAKSIIRQISPRFDEERKNFLNRKNREFPF